MALVLTSLENIRNGLPFPSRRYIFQARIHDCDFTALAAN